MVRFEKDKFTIEIPNFTTEDWLILHRELCYVIRWIDEEKASNDFYAIADFLGQLMPDLDCARKMEIK